MDGLNTSSSDNWVYPLSDYLGLPLTAFSYKGVNYHYVAGDTWQSLRLTARTMQEYFPKRAESTMIPICFSLGGPAFLLAFGSWARRFQEPTAQQMDLRRCFPLIILVQPAICPPKEFLADYYDLGADEIPQTLWPVLELCDPRGAIGAAVTTDLVDSFRLIADSSIPVYLIHWPADVVAPYPFRGSIQRQMKTPNIHLWPITSLHLDPKTQTDPRKAVLAHFRISRVLPTYAAIAEILRIKRPGKSD